MKREGRQHGMVRSYMILPPPWNSKPKSKVVNKLTSPPTAGVYTRVPSKPTNHSKFTGMACHTHPKNKAKGTQKLKSGDIVQNHRSIAWRVVDKGVGLNCTGVSATGILDHLSDEHWDEDNDMEDSDVAQAIALVDDGPAAEFGKNEEEQEEEDPSRQGAMEDYGMFSHKEGLVWDSVGEDEDWCLVGELQLCIK